MPPVTTSPKDGSPSASGQDEMCHSDADEQLRKIGDVSAAMLR
jgi:hypothetical protein